MDKTKSVVRPEHDFRQSREEWERVVFDNATLFRVSRFHGKGRWTAKDFTTFPAAVRNALTDNQAMIAAVCDSGRWIRCDRAEWSEWMKRWKARRKRK